jgi:hypothetical protein
MPTGTAIVFLLTCWADAELSRFPPQHECKQWLAYFRGTTEYLECQVAIALPSSATLAAASDIEHLQGLINVWALLSDAQAEQDAADPESQPPVRPVCLQLLRQCLSLEDYAAGRMPLPRWAK